MSGEFVAEQALKVQILQRILRGMTEDDSFKADFSRSARASRGRGSTLVTNSLILSHPSWETFYIR